MRIKLTPAFVQRARAEDGAERSVFWDTVLPRFGLQVTAAGHRSYVVQYRVRGRSRRMAIDGVLGLEAARKQARVLLGEVAKDRDPLADRRSEAVLERDTFKAIAEKYFAREGKKLRTVGDRERALARLVYPKLGPQPISAIQRSDIVRLLDDIEDQSGPVMADRTLAYVGRIMSWHASRSDDFRSPIVRGMARSNAKESARKRTLIDDKTGDELRAVWREAEATPGPFGVFVKFLLLTGARRTEAAGMTWGELANGDWTLPASRNKTKLDLVRPLSKLAQAELARLPRVGNRGFVFTIDGARPLGGFSHFKKKFDVGCGVTGWTLHDLRRTTRSLLSRLSRVVPSDHAERCLGHVIGGVRGVYDRHEFYDEKRQAYEHLAALIESVVHPPADKVVNLR
jgi:integrase